MNKSSLVWEERIKDLFLANVNISPFASGCLDAIRAGAAGIVLLNHLRALFFVDWADVERPNLFNKGLYFLSSLGHLSVMVFFVLSGFFIAGSVFRSYFSNKWSWKIYLVQRLTRLGIVLLPALVLTLFWDRLGISVFGQESVYAGLPSDRFILGPVLANSSTTTFAGNVLFLQSIFVPAFGSNGPLWSLSYEFWYYIAFPIVLFLALAQSWRQRVFCCAILICLALFVKEAIASRFLIWLLGVVVLLLPPQFQIKSRKNAIAAIAVASLPFAFFCILQKNPRLEAAIDFLVGTAFALLLYVIVRVAPIAKVATETKATLRPVAKNGIAHQMAAFSYTLYLTHMPFIVFIHAAINQQYQAKWQPDPLHLSYGVGLACLAIAYAWGIAQLTEARTDVVRRKIQSSLTLQNQRSSG